MRFFEVVLSGAALMAAAFAVELNDVPTSIEPGKTYTITYSPKDNTPTTLKLRQGDPNDLHDVAVLTSSATGGSFQWTVAELPNGKDYAIEIDQEGADPNYSGLITLTGGSDAVSSAASSASASATPSASASSSSAASKVTVISSMMTTVTSGSMTMSSTVGSNSTVTTATLSKTASSTSEPTDSASGTASGGVPESTGAASSLASSPFALIFGVVGAMAYLN